MQTAVAEAMSTGTFNWEAWAQSLTPFLHGLTPAEAQRVNGSTLHAASR
jgi:hypothetical protein